MRRERLLDILPKSLKVNKTAIRVLLINIGCLYSSCTCAYRLNLDKSIQTWNSAVCMTSDKKRVIAQRYFKILHSFNPHAAYMALIGKVVRSYEGITLQTFPVTPDVSHLPQPTLPLVVNVVTFIKNVQELWSDRLSRLEIGVICLSTGQNPVVGSSGAPALFGSLRRVHNVLASSGRLGILLNHMSLNITHK